MRSALLVLLFASAAFAQPAGPFTASAPLTLGGTEGLHRVELPPEAYRETRRDLADVRILNGRGEAVPIAFAGDVDAQREVLPIVELPLFPVSSLAPAQGGRGSEVTVRTQDGTLVSIRGKTPAATTARAVAYLLDASAVAEPMKALLFDWEAGPGQEVVRVRVESSDDLRSWNALASAPLVRVENAGRMLAQPRVEFPPRKAKYLRLTWDTPGFVLKGVRAERESKTQPPARMVRTASATPGAKEGEFVYDLGARLPVEALRLVPADANDVVSAAILARNDEKEAWRPVAWAPFYRLQHEGIEQQSPPLEIGRLPARYWMARLSPGAGSARAPQLEYRWRNAQLVFVARGEGPFALAYGNPQATPAALPLATLIPGYERGAELRLPEAKAGAVVQGPPPSRWERIVGEAQPRRIALWAVLLAGVATLGVMAWRLSRQMR